MGASRGTMFFRVFLPAAAPQLFSGARIALANSFVILFAAGADRIAVGGLGPLISEGEDAARFDLMFAGIVTFAILGFASDRILMSIRRHMLRGQMIGTAGAEPAMTMNEALRRILPMVFDTASLGGCGRWR